MVWFGGEVNIFYVFFGGDGILFGKDDIVCVWFFSFLNIGRGVFSSNENYFLFGVNCKEDCILVVCFLKKVVSDISDLEKSIFFLDCNGIFIDVKFKILEFLNDMKMLVFFVGELFNVVMYFLIFVDVSSDIMNKFDGIFGFIGKEVWKLWRYEIRINVVK